MSPRNNNVCWWNGGRHFQFIRLYDGAAIARRRIPTNAGIGCARIRNGIARSAWRRRSNYTRVAPSTAASGHQTKSHRCEQES
jgi:hypothetical protein